MILKLKPFFALFLFCIVAFGCSRDVILDSVRVPEDAASLARGRALVKGLAACGFCHGENATPDSVLIGGRNSFDVYGEVIAPNITPDKSGIGDWSPQEVVRAIREDTGKDDRDLSLQVHSGFQWISENDVLSIVGYLRTLPPIENSVERRSVSFIARNTAGILESKGAEVGYVPHIDPKFEVQYGGYLVDHVARCIQCHNSAATFLTAEEYLIGGKTIKTSSGEKVSPGITNSKSDGIGSWSEENIVTFLKTSKTPQGHFSDPAFCPTGFYKNAEEKDLKAIAKYLKSLAGAN